MVSAAACGAAEALLHTLSTPTTHLAALHTHLTSFVTENVIPTLKIKFRIGGGDSLWDNIAHPHPPGGGNGTAGDKEAGETLRIRCPNDKYLCLKQCSRWYHGDDQALRPCKEAVEDEFDRTFADELEDALLGEEGSSWLSCF